MKNLAPNHLAFVDESGYNTGRYGSLSLLTLNINNIDEINKAIENFLPNSELKWNKVRSSDLVNRISQILGVIINLALQNKLRVDTIIWDKHDSRHNIIGRSDLRNFTRMYYFLFKNVLFKKYDAKCIWLIHPDEHSSKPWEHLNYLEEAFVWNTYEPINIKISKIEPLRSESSPLIQICDLFSGLSIYSRDSFLKYQDWKKKVYNNLSKADLIRCEILENFNMYCKRNKIGISLEKYQGLRTLNPSKPINFWFYEPQSGDDKAPKRIKRKS